MPTLAEKLVVCQDSIGYNFNNKWLCATALNTWEHGTAIDRGPFTLLPRNDRMAVYGDALASAHLCQKWINTRLSKGEWTTIRQSVLSNQNLAEVGFMHGLELCVLLNPGTSSVSKNTMSTTIEALLAAVHIDGGDAALEQVIARLGLIPASLEEV